MNYTAACTLPRTRIAEALAKALGEYGLVVLTAPMGYGKSTALKGLSAISGRRVFYLAPKNAWHNEEHLWNVAFDRLAEQGAKNAASLKAMGFPRTPEKLLHVLESCRACLKKHHTILVIDDYQNIVSPEVDGLLGSLVREELPGFSILLMSRLRPKLPLEDLRLKGYATAFGEELLRFTQDETRQLFALAGVADPKIADVAQTASEGWAAALRVCLQSYKDTGVIKPAANLDDLLSETFFATYEEQDQELLLKLCVRGSFSAAQAALLCDDPAAPRRIAEMYKRNAFISYSPEGDSYALHGLFRKYLLKKLEGKGLPACEKIDLPHLYGKAAECCLLEGDYLQAIKLFARAGRDEDLLRIVRLFEAPGEGLPIALDPEGVDAIMDDIPWRIRLESPTGCLGFIHRYMVGVNVARAAKRLEEFERHVAGETKYSAALTAKIKGEVELIRAVGEFNDIAEMCRHYKRASGLLQGRSSLVDTQMFWTFYSPHSALLYLREPGGYKELLATARDGLPFFDQVSGGANAGAYDLLEAEYYLETGDLFNVHHSLIKAEYKANETGQLTARVAIAFTRARFFLAQGNVAEAGKELARLHAAVRESGHPLLFNSLRACSGYIAAVGNNDNDIPPGLFDDDSRQSIRYLSGRTFAFIVQGRALIARKEWDKLEAFAEDAEVFMRSERMLYGVLHTLIFKAIAAMHTHVHNTAVARKYFFQALDLAAPDGIVTSIAEYGRHLYPLLQRLENLNPEKSGLGILARRTKKYTHLSGARKIRLTLHEQDILEKAAKGASNREISEELGITPGSVANALSRIYGKLDAGSRLEAIHKWFRENAEPSTAKAE